MKSKPGTYVLVLRSTIHSSIQVGKWGCLDIRPGSYFYVGSAFGPGGLKARVTRHIRGTGKKHWHIDWLREFTDLTGVYHSHSPDRLEHIWATALAAIAGSEPVKGFGCSDCTCDSHLFYFSNKPEESVVIRMIDGNAAFAKVKP